MRTSLFLTTLFAFTLVSGAALADKGSRGAERLRVRGDTVDKSYRGAADRPAAPQAAAPRAAERVRPALDVSGRSRVSCSDTSMDCAQRSSTRGHTADARVGGAERGGRMPAVLEKAAGKDRTSFNEAGEDQGMSSRAAKRAWARAGQGVSDAPGGKGSAAPDAQKALRERATGVSSSARMVCNEAGECMMSSKTAKKEWAYQSVKAGTFKPEAAEPTPAARAWAAMKGTKVER